MIKDITVFTIICDSCGKNLQQSDEYCGYNDKSYIEDAAEEANWVKQEEKHYCPDCYEYDDEDDLVLLK